MNLVIFFEGLHLTYEFRALYKYKKSFAQFIIVIVMSSIEVASSDPVNQTLISACDMWPLYLWKHNLP